jgi:hypothetical protein
MNNNPKNIYIKPDQFDSKGNFIKPVRGEKYVLLPPDTTNKHFNLYRSYNGNAKDNNTNLRIAKTA